MATRAVCDGIDSVRRLAVSLCSLHNAIAKKEKELVTFRQAQHTQRLNAQSGSSSSRAVGSSGSAANVISSATAAVAAVAVDGGAAASMTIKQEPSQEAVDASYAGAGAGAGSVKRKADELHAAGTDMMSYAQAQAQPAQAAKKPRRK